MTHQVSQKSIFTQLSKWGNLYPHIQYRNIKIKKKKKYIYIYIYTNKKDKTWVQFLKCYTLSS